MGRQLKSIHFAQRVLIEPKKSFTKNFFDDRDYKEGTPFKNIILYNIDTACDLELYENSNDEFFLIPSNYIFQKEDREINRLRIKNTNETESVEILLVLNNDDTELSLLREIKELLK